MSEPIRPGEMPQQFGDIQAAVKAVYDARAAGDTSLEERLRDSLLLAARFFTAEQQRWFSICQRPGDPI